MKWKLIQALPCGGLLVTKSNSLIVICILSFLLQVIGRDFDSVLNLVFTEPPPNASDTDTLYHSRLNKWNGLSSEMISPPPRESFYDSSSSWVFFSFPPNGFISQLIVLSTSSISCSSFPRGAHSVFPFSRSDSLSEGERWGGSEIT